jgi:hypothetical protein
MLERREMSDDEDDAAGEVTHGSDAHKSLKMVE